MRYFGAHVSTAGGLVQALHTAAKAGINTIQIHPSAPQRWNTAAYPPGTEDAFNTFRPQSGVKKVFFHGIYLINLATPDDKKFTLGKLSLINYLDLCDRLNADGVIFHVGSMKDQPDESIGYDRVVQALNSIFDRAKNNSKLILEVAAGAGSIIGDQMEELRLIYDQVEQKERLGFGLDTQHMWASEYDWKNNLETIVSQIESILTLEKVWSIHLNDSKTALASRKDRHADIGEGEIGGDALKAVFLHPKFKNIPFILETPALENYEGMVSEVEKLRGFLQ